MTYLVTDNCIKCKHTDCVEVCPVDCFYETETFLAINPDECIDCGVCVPECPANAIVGDGDLQEPDLTKWLKINTEVCETAPNIYDKKEPLPEWEKYDGEANKYEKYGIKIND